MNWAQVLDDERLGEAGRPADLEEWVGRHPAIADRLQRLLEGSPPGRGGADHSPRRSGDRRAQTVPSSVRISRSCARWPRRVSSSRPCNTCSAATLHSKSQIFAAAPDPRCAVPRRTASGGAFAPQPSSRLHLSAASAASTTPCSSLDDQPGRADHRVTNHGVDGEAATAQAQPRPGRSARKEEPDDRNGMDLEAADPDRRARKLHRPELDLDTHGRSSARSPASASTPRRRSSTRIKTACCTATSSPPT